MTSQRSNDSHADSELSHDTTPTSETANADARSKTEFVRQAEMVANGQMPFPADLPEDEAERLRLEVARQRREMLINFIARAIARDIRNDLRESTRR